MNRIEISKSSFNLSVVSETGELLYSTKVAVGLNPGNKTVAGDCRTPEGTFSIQSIEDSSLWKHDFNDGRGPVPAYGPYFFRLLIPGFTGIGIHGTCFPESIGTRATLGCVRVENHELARLREMVEEGMEVRIVG